MKELGESAPRCHVEMRAGRVREYGFDLLLLWGEMAEHYAEGAVGGGHDRGPYQVVRDKEELVALPASASLDENDVVLVKGSRSMKMEEVVNAVTGREE